MKDDLVVLVVDDSPYDRAMVKRELRKEFPDVRVIEITNAEEFSDALRDPVFDLVITDFQIRWTNGLKVLQTIRQLLPECPVLMFTATGGEETAVEAMKAGLNDYIIKNLHHMVRLRGAVRAVLENTEARSRVQILESHLDRLLTTLQVGVFRRTEDGTIVEANEPLAQLLRVSSAEDLVGKQLPFADTDPDQFDKHPGDTPSGQTTECRLRRADGSVFWAAVSETRIPSERGQDVFEGLLLDISDRKRAEEELAKLQDELADADRVNTMAEMAAGISHQLTQPLTVITSLAAIATDALAKPDFNADEVRKFLMQIHNCGLEAGRVLRGLNQFVEHHPRHPQPTDLAELIRSSVDLLNVELRRNEVSTELTLPEQIPMVNIDPIQIRQVVVNVLRFTVDLLKSVDSTKRSVQVVAEVLSSEISVQICQQSADLPADELDQLFLPYVGVEKRSDHIGLSIAARIVAAHGGTITARQQHPAGTQIELVLPLTAS